MSDWLPHIVRAAGVGRMVKAGHILFRTGQPATGFYEVASGSIRLFRTDRAGRETILQTAAARETFAETSLFSPEYHCDAIATTDSVVRIFPKAAVMAEFDRNPKVAQAFASMLARQVMNLRTRLEQRNIHPARNRIRHYLELNVGSDGHTVKISKTVKDLAAELGLSREQLHRALAELAMDGEIERGKNVIKLGIRRAREAA
jgi:CRP-like cAMP-binding protein